MTALGTFGRNTMKKRKELLWFVLSFGVLLVLPLLYGVFALVLFLTSKKDQGSQSC